jgi:hypothetical protein
VDEYVLAAFVALDEAETLLDVEELDLALAGANDLRGHAAAARSTAVAAAETAATATTAETAPTAAAVIGEATAAAEPVTSAELRRTPILERIERFFAESVPLVASPAATTSIVTHLTHVPSLRPHPTPGAMDEKRRTANGGDPPALSPFAYSLK